MRLLVLVLSLLLSHPAVEAQSVRGVGDLNLVDSAGRTIGRLHLPSQVVFELPDGTLVTAEANREGFILPEDTPELEFESNDCSGQAYSSATEDDLLFYPFAPPTFLGPPGKTIFRPRAGAEPVDSLEIGSVACIDCEGGCRPCGPRSTLVSAAPIGSTSLVLADASAFPASGTVFLTACAGSSNGRDFQKDGNTLRLSRPTDSFNLPAGSIIAVAGGFCPICFFSPRVPVDPVADLDEMFTPPFRAAPAQTVDSSCCGDCNGNGNVGIDELVTGVTNALGRCKAD